MAPETHSQETVTLDELDYFPPTVVGHDTWEDGVTDLLLLDSGTTEDPRFLRVYPDDRPMEGANI